MSFTQDVHFHTIVIDNDNNSFKIQYYSAPTWNDITVTVSTGEYMLHDDATTHSTYPGLLYAIRQSLDTKIGGVSWEWGANDPVQTGITDSSLYLSNDGLRLFRIIFDDASFTMDPRWFGFRVDKGQLTSSNTLESTGTGAGGAQWIQGDYSTLGRYFTTTIHPDDSATTKDRSPYADTRLSSPNASSAVAVTWDTGFKRVMQYEYVPSGMIYSTRCEDAGYASFAGVSQYDINNAYEDVWDSMRKLYPGIIVHNSSSDLEISTHDYEVVKYADEGATRSLDSVASRMQLDGDLYRIRLNLEVLSGSYDH